MLSVTEIKKKHFAVTFVPVGLFGMFTLLWLWPRIHHEICVFCREFTAILSVFGLVVITYSLMLYYTVHTIAPVS